MSTIRTPDQRGRVFVSSTLQELATERQAVAAAAVLEQPVGITEVNRPLYEQMWRSWGARLSSRTDLDPEHIENFGTRMWRGDFVLSVPRDFVRSCSTPLLVLPGTDRCHPTAAGREIAALAPNGRVIEPWNDSGEHALQAAAAVRNVLQAHSPRQAP